MKARKLTGPEALDAAIIKNAVYFTSVVFKGRGKYDRREYDDRASAIAGAAPHATEIGNGRSAIVYAVDRHGRQAFVTTCKPERRHA